MRLVGDCLLGAAFLSYCGAFTYEFRHALLQGTWLPGVLQEQLPTTSPFRCAALFKSLDDSCRQSSAEEVAWQALTQHQAVQRRFFLRWQGCVSK